MSSPAPFFASSSPPHAARPRSQFTYKHLHQLKSFSATTPLRTIAHVDLDAFYAQCETVRLGIDPAKPLAVQQWGGLIAINYPARAFGLNRHITSVEALKLCPELVMQHVATWKEGEDGWAYRDDANRHIATHKVSLDPYRLQSRRILKCIKEGLPEGLQRVEKASIDEVFLDLSAQIHRVLLQRYPELQEGGEDPTARLPRPPTTVLDWQTDALVGIDGEEGEEDEGDPDWDDMCVAIASEIVRGVRKKIYDDLGYTCSAGIAKNKMVAKLGSGYKKPNQQTVIRSRAIRHFLSDMKFTKIRMLGGKLGDEVVSMYQTDKVKELLEVPIEQLKKLGDDTGSWLYQTIRGEDQSEVNPRTQIKSMLSAKSFRPAINSFEQGVRWLRIFAADIFSRCVEEGVLEHKRRPKTINLHHRQGAQTRSRQGPIPQGKVFTEAMLFDLAKNLLAQVVVDGRAWPCANLSLSVGGFEDGPTGNKGIGGFLVRGQEAKAMLANERGSMDSIAPPAKRRRTQKGNIANFFGPRDAKKQDFDTARAVLLASRQSSRASESDEDSEAPDQPEEHDDEFGAFEERPATPPAEHAPVDELHNRCSPPSAQPQRYTSPTLHPHTTSTAHSLRQQTLSSYICPRCKATLPPAEAHEHEDWHFAMDLSKNMRQEVRTAATLTMPSRQDSGEKKPGRGRGRPPGAGAGAVGRGRAAGGTEKGQARLAFGKG